MEIKFGEKLRLLRTRAGLSLKKVGKEVGLDWSTVSKYEREKESWKQIPYEMVEKFAHALHVPPDVLTNDHAA